MFNKNLLDLMLLRSQMVKFSTTNLIDEKLKCKDCTVENLFEIEELIQEATNGNEKLISFLVKKDSIRKLIDYITKMPEEDEHLKGHRYPFMANEVLACNNDTFYSYFLENKKEILNTNVNADTENKNLEDNKKMEIDTDMFYNDEDFVEVDDNSNNKEVITDINSNENKENLDNANENKEENINIEDLPNEEKENNSEIKNEENKENKEESTIESVENKEEEVKNTQENNTEITTTTTTSETTNTEITTEKVSENPKEETKVTTIEEEVEVAINNKRKYYY